MLLGRIEHGAIYQTTLVDNLHLIALLRHLTCTLCNHLVLQAARQYLHTWLLGILGEELLASTSQSLLLEILGSLRSKESSVASQCCHETLLEESVADRVVGTLQFLLGTRIDTLLHQLGNLHTSRVSDGLRIHAHSERILVTTDEVLHVGGIHLIALLNIVDQSTSGIDTSSIAQRIG